jgi:hypothetical protein
VKGLFEFSNVIVIEAVDVKLDHANDFVVIFGSRGHRSLPLPRSRRAFTQTLALEYITAPVQGVATPCGEAWVKVAR